MGGGGAKYTGPTSADALRRAEEAREKERERLVGDINQFLAEKLARLNDRDVAGTQARLDTLREALGDTAKIDTILFGGSVAKQTAVQGLSDVDALVVLSDPELVNRSPSEVVDLFLHTLRVSLSRGDVKDISRGSLAVTVTYDDGTEIQLLPAVRSGQQIEISSARGGSWIPTDPAAFRTALSRANERAGRALVPAVKLLKAIVAQLPEQKRLTGYHAEALAIDAMARYAGPYTPRGLVLRILEHASERVLNPMDDVTGQSRNVDDYLGQANSVERRNVAQALHWLGRRLNAARSVGQWSAALGDETQ